MLVALQTLTDINLGGPLCLPYGSTDAMDGELSAFSIVDNLCEKVKSSKLEAKVRLCD